MDIKLMVDGEPVLVQNDVKLILDTDLEQELHLTFIHEGMVTDIVEDGEVVESTSETYVEMMEDWVDE